MQVIFSYTNINQLLIYQLWAGATEAIFKHGYYLGVDRFFDDIVFVMDVSNRVAFEDSGRIVLWLIEVSGGDCTIGDLSCFEYLRSGLNVKLREFGITGLVGTSYGATFSSPWMGMIWLRTEKIWSSIFSRREYGNTWTKEKQFKLVVSLVRRLTVKRHSSNPSYWSEG